MSRRMIAMLAVLALVSALLLTGCSADPGSTTPGPTGTGATPTGVDVPKVVGKTQKAAQEAFDAAGLNVEVRYHVDAAKSGTVIEQSPDRGQVTPDSWVQITVAYDAAQTAVPDVVGRLKRDAEARIITSQLKFKIVTGVDSPDTAAGSVYRQSPAAGTPVDKHTVVTLYVQAAN